MEEMVPAVVDQVTALLYLPCPATVEEQVVVPLGESEEFAHEAVTLLTRIGMTGAGTLTTVIEYGGSVMVEPPTRD